MPNAVLGKTFRLYAGPTWWGVVAVSALISSRSRFLSRFSAASRCPAATQPAGLSVIGKKMTLFYWFTMHKVYAVHRPTDLQLPCALKHLPSLFYAYQ